MRRLLNKLLTLAIALTAVLVPGTAVFAQQPCPAVPEGAAFDAAVRDASVIVVGTFDGTTDDADSAVWKVRPEVYLKGPARAGELALAQPPPSCASPGGAPKEGERLLLIASKQGEGLTWPPPNFAFTLQSGQAFALSDPQTAYASEFDLIARIRAITNQYAVPAESSDEGAGIDWGHTVLPLALALGAVFVIGLFLMRIWHRIDPS